MYAAVRVINYITESVASWEKKTARWRNCGLQYPVSILRNIDAELMT